MRWSARWLSIGLVLGGCANPLPPPGGPPDREPPRVVWTVPASGSTHVPRQTEIAIHFSEFVDKASVLAALALQPPHRWEASWDWWGKTLRLRFPEPLDSATTYVLILGSDYRDLAGNTAAEATSVVFSTGAVVDRGRIEGRLLDPQPAGVFVLAYPMRGMAPDTLNPQHTRPRFWTQVGTAGTFRLEGLPEGEYRLFALRDGDRDGLYSEGRDALGTTVGPVRVRADTAVELVLRLNPPVDRVPPDIVDVRPQSRQRIRVLVSEPLDTASVTPEAFAVEDTTGVRYALAAAYLVPGSQTMVDVVVQHPLPDTGEYAMRLLPGGLRDTAGNAVGDSSRAWRFRAVAEEDTAAVRWVSIVPPDSSRSVLPWQPLELVADGALDSTAAELAVVDASGRSIPVQWQVRAANHWRVMPLSRWEPGQWYRFQVRFRSRALPGGRQLLDTLVVRSFQALDTRSYADIAGELRDSLGCPGPYWIVLRAVRGGAGIWRQRLERPGPWRFPELPPGLYELEVFCDADGDGRYSAGSAYPYRFAERFVVVGPLELKPRWSLEGVVVTLP